MVVEHLRARVVKHLRARVVKTANIRINLELDLNLRPLTCSLTT
jgi:hypothetical protein